MWGFCFVAVIVVFGFVCLFFETGLLCSHVYPRICYVDQVGLQLTEDSFKFLNLSTQGFRQVRQTLPTE